MKLLAWLNKTFIFIGEMFMATVGCFVLVTLLLFTIVLWCEFILKPIFDCLLGI